ncbi:unnamed protein product, partial [Staurois parvus]
MPAVIANQCHLPVPISASSMPHISAHLSSAAFSVTYQCQSVPPINASQCHLSVLSISAAHQCQSVPPINTSQCRLTG